MKRVLVYFFCGIIVAAGFFVFYFNYEKTKKPAINSFDECAKVNPIESQTYPPQCKTSDGRVFTQDVGNEMQFQDQIELYSPRPNQIVTSPLDVAGRARGSWYFEGVIQVILYGNDNIPIAQTSLHSEGEWMTEDFVDFSGTIAFTKPTKSTTGKLVIRKGIASGLKSTQQELVIPVSFE